MDTIKKDKKSSSGKMILFTTILNRLSKVYSGFDLGVKCPLHCAIDVRYLDRWVKAYPDAFPSFMLSGGVDCYKVVYNSNLMRYEIWPC